MPEFTFEETFRGLTGYLPMPWQEKMYSLLLENKVPAFCNLPTGMGKTSIMAIWLIALSKSNANLPRRLVYVVNRRTVVDQATREAEKLRANLDPAKLREPLNRLCALEHDVPLAISTLRGQFADNGEWYVDPARPAIIVGTVDMIGSRLLFSGYGVGFRTRPLHAGFLGQDALLIHDEAHLEAPFQRLLEEIQYEQQGGRGTDFRPLRVMALSATNRKPVTVANQSESTEFELTDREKSPPEACPEPATAPIHHVWRRLTAKKTLRLHSVSTDKKLVEKVVESAKQYRDSGKAILVFVNGVKESRLVRDNLKQENLELLTGTIRGLERDELIKKPIFQRFLPKSNQEPDIIPQEGTVYLICTSAGEVGIDISADHLVCDLVPFERMAQRFGRVNRYGDTNATIDVVYPKQFDDKSPLSPFRVKTMELLKKLCGNASPKALGELPYEACLSAFTPIPVILGATDILFDAWALTTITQRLPGRPPVAPYLHGLADWEPPETQVAWREEVGVITGDLLNRYTPADLLDHYPLKPHELLRDTSERIFNELKELNKRSGKTIPVWIVTQQGEVLPRTLADLAENEQVEKKASSYPPELANGIVILPPEAGGLRAGILTADAEPADNGGEDVSSCFFDETGCPRRQRIWNDEPVPEGMRLIRTFDVQVDSGEDDTPEEQAASGRFWRWYELPKGADNEGSKSANQPVTMKVHTDDVVRTAERMATALCLPEDISAALSFAARFHDSGKCRRLWQRSIGNFNPDNWLAKSGRRMRPIEISTYRHEFGSLRDARAENSFQGLSEASKALAMHLIAAHHGRARPHFPQDEAFDPEPKGNNANEVARETPRRFAHLQRHHGRWGLAYLESLLRAADYASSANPSEFLDGTKEKTK